MIQRDSKRFLWKMILLDRELRKSGMYSYVIKNLLKTILIVSIVIIALIILQKNIIDFGLVYKSIITKFPNWLIMSIFFVSESLLGLIPPDIFILWAKPFPNTFLVITILAIFSYLGGVVSFYIGKNIGLIPKIYNYIERNNRKIFSLSKRWGGQVILVAAIFPLPFSIACMIAGMIRFSFRKFLIYSTARLFRFYVYAYIMFEFIDKSKSIPFN